MIRWFMTRRALRKAARLRAEALSNLRKAESRNDDRDIGRARMIVAELTHTELRLSVRGGR